MTRTQKAALTILGVVTLAALAAGWLAPSYAQQFRDSISAPPSAKFPLGRLASTARCTQERRNGPTQDG